MNDNIYTDELLDDIDDASLDEMAQFYYSSLSDAQASESAQGGLSLTPPSVTDPSLSDSYKIAIGWITMSFFCSNLAELVEDVSKVEKAYCNYMMDEFCEVSFPCNTYKNVRKFNSGTIIAYTEGRPDFCLIIPQTVCDRFTIPYLLHLIKVLGLLGGRLTRLDLPIDDFSKSLNIDRVFESSTSGEMVTRLRKVKRDREIDRTSGKVTDDCLRLGSRKKQFYVRVYDKDLDTNGKIKSIRLEAELKGAFARTSFSYIYAQSFTSEVVGEAIEFFDQSKFNKAVLAVLLTRIDFRDPNSDSNISRRKRSGWWSRFCEGVEKIKLTIPKVEKRIEKTLNWLADGVSTSLAIAAEFLQEDFVDFLSGILSYGKSRLKPRHWALLFSPVPEASASSHGVG